MPNERPNRRRILTAGAAGAGTLLLGGCDRLSSSEWFRRMLGIAEEANYRAQRLLLGNRLAPEFTDADITPNFKANGTESPPDAAYKTLAKTNFVHWRLAVDGLVDRPLKLSLAEFRQMPSRTQITRHDCVEGWSCIGKWKGTPLANILERAGVKPQARYVVFHCADTMEGGEAEDGSASENPAKPRKAGASEPVRYYESIDLDDAHHPQTILAYEMNDIPLPIPHGAPVRLRVERQLGYKMAKYVMRIELVERFDQLAGGRGGYWEDRGYEWFAGI